MCVDGIKEGLSVLFKDRYLERIERRSRAGHWKRHVCIVVAFWLGVDAIVRRLVRLVGRGTFGVIHAF